MAGSSSEKDVFDVERIRELVELMEQHDLSQVDLRQGETRVQLRRGGKLLEMPAGPAVAPTPTTPAPPADAPTDMQEASQEHIVAITSPMVGTFYSAADPGTPAYVKVGDHVGPETTVCIIEAMKVFNQIPAEVTGKVVAVLVENGDPVEYGQPMFKVDTRE